MKLPVSFSYFLEPIFIGSCFQSSTRGTVWKFEVLKLHGGGTDGKAFKKDGTLQGTFFAPALGFGGGERNQQNIRMIYNWEPKKGK